MRVLNEVEKAIVRTVASHPLCSWQDIQSICYPSWDVHPQRSLEEAYWFVRDNGIIKDEGAYYTTDWTIADANRGVS